MSWDQEYHIESLSQFLARLVNIDVTKLVAVETARRMDKKGLSVVKADNLGSVDNDYISTDSRLRITLSDGRVFVHKKVRVENWDDMGSEEWELRLIGEDTKVEQIQHDYR